MSRLRDIHISVAIFPFRWIFELSRYRGYFDLALGPLCIGFEIPSKSEVQWSFPEYRKPA